MVETGPNRTVNAVVQTNVTLTEVIPPSKMSLEVTLLRAFACDESPLIQRHLVHLNFRRRFCLTLKQ